VAMSWHRADFVYRPDKHLFSGLWEIVRARFVADSPLEGTEFELSVPREIVGTPKTASVNASGSRD
jgi:hypothetical protein